MKSHLHTAIALGLLVATSICYGQGEAADRPQTNRALEPRLRFSDPADMESAYLDPYIEVHPRSAPPIPGLEKSVIYFFSPDCSASHKLHDNIMHWGGTLPEGWRFLPLAIAGPDHTAPALVGFAGRLEAMNGGGFIEDQYWHLLYEAALNRGWNLDDIDGAVEMAVQAGADESRLRKILNETPEPAQATIDTAKLVLRYELDRTPMLVIADRWLTNPDLVGSNPLNLMQVGNALVSLAISEANESEKDDTNGVEK